MTVVYNLEVTMQYADEDNMYERAEKCVLSPVLKERWEHKVEKETERAIPDINVVCTDIHVFGVTEA